MLFEFLSLATLITSILSVLNDKHKSPLCIQPVKSMEANGNLPSAGNRIELELGRRRVLSGFKPDKTRAAIFLNGFKNIPGKACVNRVHNSYVFVNVGN